MKSRMAAGLDGIIEQLRNYNGKPVTIMEVCGSHTAAIAKSGIKSLLSENIRLIAGPGCPVCVTPTAYIDRLIELSKEKDTCVVTFGDLLRVPGSRESLSEAKSEGARVRMVYSPMDIVKLAGEEPAVKFVFAAVGFETTTPIYALLVERLITDHIENVRILTALKTMPEVMAYLLEHGAKVDGFLAPGHVCAITGSERFTPVANKYHVPMAVAGFQPGELAVGIYGLVHEIGAATLGNNENRVKNYYPSVVTEKGNELAQAKVLKYFEPCDAVWRGMGIIPMSGMMLKKEYARFDAGSAGLVEDHKKNKGCQCDQVLMGTKEPKDCPLFGKACNPQMPQGACMVSEEGSCHTYYMNR